MKRKFIVIISSVIILSGISCEEIIEFKGEALDPKIVVYGILNPDSLISVSIAKSYPVFQPNYTPSQIRNAEVKIFKNDEFLETLTYVPSGPANPYSMVVPLSKYTSSVTKPDISARYRVEVAIPGLKTATSEVSFPAFVPVEKFDTVRQVITGTFFDEKYINVILNVKINFQDPPKEENYYRINLVTTHGYYNGDKSIPYSSENPVMVLANREEYIISDDPIVAPPQNDELFGNTVSNRYNVFSDELISGKSYDFNLKISYTNIDTAYHEFSIRRIELQSISKDLYLFLRSITAHTELEGDFISEPVIVYSNVENGLGIIGTQMSSGFVISYGDYPVEGVKYENYEYYY